MKKKSFVVMAMAIALPFTVAAQGPPPDGTVVGHETWYDEGQECHYKMQYRGSFHEDGYQQDGWIRNHIRCDDGAVYTYMFVHETDARYTGDEDLAIWGSWEWHILTASGYGNVANPAHPNYMFRG